MDVRVHIKGWSPFSLSQPALRILLIEDNPGDAELVRASLAEATDTEFHLDHAGALVPGLDRLARGDIDLVLLDVSLPDSHGLDGLNAIRILAPSVPVVLLTGWDSDSLSLRAVQNGAQDYLVKGEVQGKTLARVLQQAIVRHRTQAGPPPVETRQPPATIVGLLGVKGGVGTSTIACHYAMELRRRGEARVLLMDLDLGGNTISFLMNASGPYGLNDACTDVLQLDQDRWKKLVVTGTEGVDVLPSGGPVFLEEKLPVTERVRFVLRFARSIYRWIVVDLGRLTPFALQLSEEVGRLHFVSTSDVLSLYEAKSTISSLAKAGFNQDSFSVIMNQTPFLPTLSRQEVMGILEQNVAAMLPECRQDFADSQQNEKRLGQSRKFQQQIAQLAAELTGAAKEATPKKDRFAFLARAFRNAAV